MYSRYLFTAPAHSYNLCKWSECDDDMKKVSGARNLLHNIDVQQTVLQLLAATTSNYSLHSLTSDIAFECGVNVKVWVKRFHF